ncbi:hypothetical protein J6E39_06565 [bacterium]|nr:hypothetical protein [bacterium]
MQVNNTPSFGARIVINKRDFRNLAENVRDGSNIISKSMSATSMSGVETASCPSAALKGKDPFELTSKSFNEASAMSEDFVSRPVCNLVESEGLPRLESNEIQNVHTVGAGLGSSVCSTGIASTGSVAGSVMDQAVYAPSLGSQYLPQNVLDYMANNSCRQSALSGYDVIARPEDVVKAEYWNVHDNGGLSEALHVAMLPTASTGSITSGVGIDLLKKTAKDVVKIIPD